MAIAALLALPVSDVAIYLMVCAAAFLPTFVLPVLALSRALRLALAGAILAVVLVHVARHGLVPEDAAAVWMNLLLLVTAGLLAGSAAAVFRRRASQPAAGLAAE